MNMAELPLDSTRRLVELEAKLGKLLPDQADTVGCFCRSISRDLAISRESPGPLGCFLLATLNDEISLKLAAVLAGFLFNDEQSVLHLAMREYAEKYQISRLIGHSGGMICAFFEGELTTPIWHQPRTVVLLSEIESAHSDVWQILAPILEEGFIIDGWGRKVMFNRSTLILTSSMESIARLEQILPAKVLRILLQCSTLQMNQKRLKADNDREDIESLFRDNPPSEMDESEP